MTRDIPDLGQSAQAPPQSHVREIECDLTRTDVERLLNRIIDDTDVWVVEVRRQRVNQIKVSLAVSGILFFVTLGVTALLRSRWKEDGPFISFAIVTSILVGVAVMYKRRPKQVLIQDSMNRTFRTGDVRVTRMRAAIDANGITTSIGESSMNVPWELIRHIERDEGMMILWRAQGSAFGVPLNSCANWNDADEFYSAATAFWTARGAENKGHPIASHCVRCGYDVSQQTVPRCPECGLVLELPE